MYYENNLVLPSYKLYYYRNLKFDSFCKEILILNEKKSFNILEQLKVFLRDQYNFANKSFEIYQEIVNEITYELNTKPDGPTIGCNGLDGLGGILFYETTVHKELREKLRKPKNNRNRYDNLRWQLESKHNFIVTLNEPIF